MKNIQSMSLYTFVMLFVISREDTVCIPGNVHDFAYYKTEYSNKPKVLQKYINSKMHVIQNTYNDKDMGNSCTLQITSAGYVQSCISLIRMSNHQLVSSL